MELKIEKSLFEKDYQIKILTSNFSTSDLKLIDNFNDPLVEMGGEVYTGTAQVEDLDLTGATSGEVSVEVQREGRSNIKVSVDFDTDVPTTANLLHLKFIDLDVGVISSYDTGTNVVRITSEFVGNGIVLSNPTQLTVTSITANNKILLATLPSNEQTLHEQLAQFFTSFNSEDYTDTELVADSYADVVKYRIKDKLLELRLREDLFSESIIITI